MSSIRCGLSVTCYPHTSSSARMKEEWGSKMGGAITRHERNQTGPSIAANGQPLREYDQTKHGVGSAASATLAA
jgi:hypothetical protein